MPAITLRILTVGALGPATAELLKNLEAKGWGARAVATLGEALELFATFKFDVVLANESLPDGRGYDASQAVARHSATLLVGVALSESRLWLPVIERGANVLGTRAFNTAVLNSDLEILLHTLDSEFAREVVRRAAATAEGQELHRAASARRKEHSS